MSRYMVDKFLWEVEHDDANLAAFLADAAGFVTTWEHRWSDPDGPHPSGGTLTNAERAACTDVDYGTLYAMGAHPYLLWHFVRAVLVTEAYTVHQLDVDFKRAVTPHGHPDFAT